MTITAAGFYRASKKLRCAITNRDERVIRLFDVYKDVGLVDTIRLILPQAAVKSELQQIVDDKKRWKTSHFTFKDRLEHKVSIDRESGLTIKFRKKCIIVEGSIPRILGMSSNEVVDGVSRDQLCGVIQSMTVGLFPRTTSVAKYHSKHWRCTRLDCAKAFFAAMDWLHAMKDLKRMKWKRTHDIARPYKNKRKSVRGIMWGRTYKRHPTARLSMYNKATEVTNKTSALKSERVKNKKVLPVANRWRIEAQSHGFQTLDRVFRVFDNGQDLYIGIGKKRRGISIDYSVMHMLVFQSILELSPPSNHNTKSYNAHTRLLDLTYPGISDALMEMDI